MLSNSPLKIALSSCLGTSQECPWDEMSFLLLIQPL